MSSISFKVSHFLAHFPQSLMLEINDGYFRLELLAIRSDYNKERISAVPRYIQQFCDAMMSKRTFQEPAQ